jgi:carbon monoxide dehydrogenase subunit G
MQIDHTFTVERSPEQVWDVFQDVPAVSQCMPGAEITEDKGDGVYAGKLTVKLGPMSSSERGSTAAAAVGVEWTSTTPWFP